MWTVAGGRETEVRSLKKMLLMHCVTENINLGPLQPTALFCIKAYLPN